ncbi:hypothetical protein N665_0154s0009 [Sinapis alba]|nr:hypothetical protein N665_0154s0009 [Sinapis alba]
MAPKRKLTREQKGKAVAEGPDLARGIDPSSVDDRLHREALSDMAGLDLAQRRLVADAETMFLGEREGNGVREGVSLESEAVVRPPRKMQSDFVHGRLSPEGFVELPLVPSGSRRSPDLSDRMEKLVGKGMQRTGATPSSVQALLERCGAVGVTYLIPAEHERSWSPPIGRQVALSQFMNGSYRIAVALMVLSAEIDISLNVRAFEELTSVKALRGGLLAIRMRPNYNIITDHPNKTQKWKKNYFYIKADEFAFHEPPGDEFPLITQRLSTIPKDSSIACAIACLSHSHWPDISEDRVWRALERISRVIKKDGGKRLALFTSRQQARVNKARKMDSMIDLSDLIGDELDNHQANPMSILNDMDLGGASGDGPHGDISAEEEKPFVAVASGTQQRGAKRPSRGGDNTAPSDDLPGRGRREASLEGGGSLAAQSLDRGGQVDGADDQIAGASAGLSKVRSVPTFVVAKGRPIEGSQLPRSPSPVQDARTPEGALLTEGPFVDPVTFLHSGNSFLVEDRGRCAELVRQIKGESFDFPIVADHTFSDLYEKAAQDQLSCIGTSNLLIAKYEGELKSTLVQLGRAQEVAQEKDRSLVCKGEELKAAKRALHKAESRAAKRKRKARAKISALKLELEAAHHSNEELKEKNAEIQQEKEALDREQATLVLEAAKEATRLRESRRSSVERERKRVEAAMIEKCDRRFANIRDYQEVPPKAAFSQRSVDPGHGLFFEGKERKLKADADAQWVGGIPETDLSLSPLALSPQASRDAERSASSSEGQSVDQAGVDAAGSQEGINAAEGQGPGAFRAGAEDPSE